MQTELSTAETAHDANYDQENDRYVFEYDPDGAATVTTTVVHALSSIANVDVSQGEFSLYDSVDPDALERLFTTKADGEPRLDGHVCFRALDHEVYVFANGDVFIYPPADECSVSGPRMR
ncbi:HalOD1 output domain-containing protein [Natrialbaceae archaeon A-CW2]|uniref:HalOD1 output domain-containing protein n=1 Tax=Natronosalvus amylolyticus TaxID=2961994 RepID=UPI0020C9A87A|nr:HalOD1 output domain-containing protein [Natronosalvus amylolyticus]